MAREQKREPDPPPAAPSKATDRTGHGALIQSMLALSPEQRLLGRRRSSAFFGAAKRV